jgi:uncharacterized protein (TIGR02588 family)
VTDVERVGRQYVAHVRAENDGGETAEGVLVSGELVLAGSTVEDASTTVAYVPPNSHRNAALLFTSDPGKLELQVREQ